MVMMISLSQEKSTVVDDEEYAMLSERSWYAVKSRKCFYAACMEGTRVILMHRVILGVVDSKITVDHADGDGLNNVRTNLRVASFNEQMQNRGIPAHNTSGYKGVSRARSGRWLATIHANGKDVYIGTYDSPQEASHHWKEAAKLYHGDFARFA